MIDSPPSGGLTSRIVPARAQLVRTNASAKGAAHRGEDCGGYRAGRFAFVEKRRTGGWTGRFGGESKPFQDLVDMPQGINTGYRFLAEITALDEADGAFVARDLLRQVLLGDVLAENRRSTGHAQYLKRLGIDHD